MENYGSILGYHLLNSEFGRTKKSDIRRFLGAFSVVITIYPRLGLIRKRGLFGSWFWKLENLRFGGYMLHTCYGIMTAGEEHMGRGYRQQKWYGDDFALG